MTREKKRRSMVKAITWRFSATIITVALIYIFTGKIALSLQIGVLEVIVKMAFYFIHERCWDNVKWGKIANNQ